MEEATKTVSVAGQDFEKRTTDLKQAFDEVVNFRKKIDDLFIKIDSVDFPERLGKIESGFTELLDIEEDLAKKLKNSVASLNAQIDKIDFNKKHEELRKDVSRIETSNSNLVREIRGLEIPQELDSLKHTVNKKMDDSIIELTKNTKKISDDTAKSILELNIPVRLEKVDANIAGIMAAIQSIQSRVDNLERNILDKLKDVQDNANQNNLNLTKAMEDSFQVLSKRQKTFTFITWAILALFAIGALVVLKHLKIF